MHKLTQQSFDSNVCCDFSARQVVEPVKQTRVSIVGCEGIGEEK